MTELQSTSTSNATQFNIVVRHCASMCAEMDINQLAEEVSKILESQSANSSSDLNKLVSEITILNQFKASQNSKLHNVEQNQLDSYITILQRLITNQIPQALSVLLGTDYQKKYELLKSFGNNIDIIFDMLFDIPPARQDNDNLYIPAPLSELVDVVNSLNLSSSDTFIDIGAGFGRVNLLVSIMSSAKSIGVEIDPWKVTIAKNVFNGIENLSNPPTIIENDVFQYDFNTASMLFLYRPFEDAQTKELLNQLLEKGIKPKVCTRLINPKLLEGLGFSVCNSPKDKTGYYVFNPPS